MHCTERADIHRVHVGLVLLYTDGTDANRSFPFCIFPVHNLDVTSSTGAQNALAVLDKAIDEVSQMRGRIGNFQRNVVETQQRSLSSMRENLANSESSIRDLDVASEMTSYTKFQVMQQAGLSILSQANQQGSAVLSLLR
jgi:flagellin